MVKLSNCQSILGCNGIVTCNVGNIVSVAPGKKDVTEAQSICAKIFLNPTNILEVIKTFLQSGADIIYISLTYGSETSTGKPYCYLKSKLALNSLVNSISGYFRKLGERINTLTLRHVLFKDWIWSAELENNATASKQIIEIELLLFLFAETEDIANVAVCSSKFAKGGLLTFNDCQTRSF